MSDGISLIGSATGGTGGANATSHNITWPGSLAVNDVAFASWPLLDTSVETTPTGFTRIRNDTGTGGNHRSTLWQKVLTGSESGSLSFATNTSQRTCSGLVVYRGVDPVTPVNGITIFDQTVASPNYNAPANTPSVPGCLTCSFISERASSIDISFTPPATFNERFDVASTGSGGTVTAWGDEGFTTDRPAGVPVDPGNWVGSHGTGTAAALVYTLHLNPIAVLGDNSDMFPFFF